MQSSSPTRDPVDRSTVLRGGAVGLGIGALLLAVVLFFLVRGFDEPAEVFGVFVPLTVALLSLALGVMALVPLRWGDTVERSPQVVALLLRLLGVIGLVVTALGFVRGELPYTAGAMLPLLVVAVLLTSAGRFAGLRRTDRG